MKREAPMLARAITWAVLSTATLLVMIPAAHASAGPSSAFSGHKAAVTRAAASIGALSVHTFWPTKGPMGTTVTIAGSGFSGATRVSFHGVVASFRVVSSTRIVATVPCGTSTGRIRVSTARARATSRSDFKIS